MWTYDEILIHLKPKLVHTVDIISPSQYESCMAKFEAKLTIVLMVSSSGKMAPPVLIFNSKNYQPFKMPGSDGILITSNITGKSLEVPYFLWKIGPPFLN